MNGASAVTRTARSSRGCNSSCWQTERTIASRCFIRTKPPSSDRIECIGGSVSKGRRRRCDAFRESVATALDLPRVRKHLADLESPEESVQIEMARHRTRDPSQENDACESVAFVSLRAAQESDAYYRVLYTHPSLDVARRRESRDPRPGLPLVLLDVDGVINIDKPYGHALEGELTCLHVMGKRLWRVNYSPRVVERINAWSRVIEERWLADIVRTFGEGAVRSRGGLGGLWGERVRQVEPARAGGPQPVPADRLDR